MKTATILVGVSGSGKSFIANELCMNDYTARIERDLFRAVVLTTKNKEYDRYSVNLWSMWKWKWEDEVTVLWDKALQNVMANGQNVVISDTNLNYEKTLTLQKLLEDNGYDVKIQIVDTPLQECINRDKNRLNTVGEQVIYGQYMKLVENWNIRKRYSPNKQKPKCILVDIDGTLAHMNGKRGPFEWDKVHLDDVDDVVRSMVNHFHNDYYVIVLSGRDGVCQQDTKKWLHDNEIEFDELFMRAAGDMRKDWIVKEELFWNHIADNYNVQFVIDDRKQVVMNTWHPIGVKVIQVGNAYIDF